MKKQTKAYLFALAAVLLWSTVSTAFKIALGYVDFLQLLFGAIITTILVLFIISLIKKNTAQLFIINRRELLGSAILGFLNPFLYYVVLLKAYSVLPAQLAQPLNYLWPVVLVLLSAPLLGQKLQKKTLIALLFGFAGVFVISTQGKITELNFENPFGVALASGSSIIWALFWILNQKDKRNEINKLFWNFVFGLIYISITLSVFSKFPELAFKSSVAIAYVGLFETGITFYLWMRALQMTERNSSISNLVFLSPFLALFFISFVLKEHIHFTTIAGLVLIVAGIFIGQNKKKEENML